MISSSGGGDSLIAAVVAAEVHAAIGIDINLKDFADHPTLAALGHFIDKRHLERHDDTLPLARAPRDRPLPMSYWQERIWSFSRTPEQSASYTMSRTHRIQGPLDARVLCDCINEVARRHEILRTTFALIGDCPAQIVHAPVLNELPCLDVTGSGDPESQAREICKGQASWLFDLSRGPLWRFLLIRLRENEYWLFRVAHHIIFDNHCWNIFFRELALLYAARLNGDAASIPEPKLQYGDYAVWQRGILRRGRPTKTLSRGGKTICPTRRKFSVFHFSADDRSKT